MLPTTWSYYTELPVPTDRPRIHGKPGLPNCREEFASEFLAAVDRTAWAGCWPAALQASEAAPQGL